MRTRILVLCLGVAFLGTELAGCSFSASASLNSDGKAVLKGKDAIAVAAAQPEAPPPPPKPKKKKKKAKLVGKKIEITEKVMFDTGKATIKADSNELLSDVGEVFKEHKNIKVRIEGHTDSVGSDRDNKKLSQERADAVKAFLVSLGIDESRMEAEGFGEERPIADNDTDEGKEKNRRVEFNIVAEEKKKKKKNK